MTRIINLSPVDSVSGSDQVPIYSGANGDARRVPLNVIKDFIEEDFEFSGGILALASIFALRKTVQEVVALTATFANIDGYDGSLVTPAGRTSFSVGTVLGEFIATRDCSHIEFVAQLTGTWDLARDLTLAVLVGTDAAPYESSFSYVGAGRGANVVTVNFTGPSANLNNPGNIIKTGEKIRLVAKMDAPGNLTINKCIFAIKTLDGI